MAYSGCKGVLHGRRDHVYGVRFVSFFAFSRSPHPFLCLIHPLKRPVAEEKGRINKESEQARGMFVNTKRDKSDAVNVVPTHVISGS